MISNDLSREQCFVEKLHRTALFADSVVVDVQGAIGFIISILESSTEYSIIAKDLDGEILLWNEGARRLYGYEPEEVVGKANASILHIPEDVKSGKHSEVLQAALHDEDGCVRLAAAIALAKIGGRPMTVVPLLIDVLEDEIDPARRWLAADVLRDLGPTAAQAAPALARALRRHVERPLVRQSIRMALNALRPAA